MYWKNIRGYTGFYQINYFGNIKSLARYVKYGVNGKKRFLKERLMKVSIKKEGYRFVRLSKNGIDRSFRINRLVAKAFIPNPRNLPEVNHIDGDKANNHKSNLEWTTKKKNLRHALMIGLRGYKKKK